MTDLQRFIDLYDSIGVEYQLEVTRDVSMLLLTPGMKEFYGPHGSVLCIVFEDDQYRHTEIFEKE